jgi:hypothetical protein
VGRVAFEKPVTRTAPDLTKEQQKLLDFHGEGFDLRTRIIDPKTGKVIRTQPYGLTINKDGSDFYTRDGKRYTRSGVEMSTQPQSAPKK